MNVAAADPSGGTPVVRMTAATGSWLTRPLPARALAAVRIATGVYAVGLVLGRGPSQLELAGDGFGWDPVGILRPFGSPPGVGLVAALGMVALASSLALVVGWRHRLTGPVCFVSVLTWATLASSWGHLFHSDNLVVLHLGVLAWFPASDAWSLDRRAGRRTDAGPSATYGWAVRLAAILTAVTYVAAGLAKARLGGWGWLDGETLRGLVAHDNLRKELIGAPSTPLAGPVVRQAWMFTPLALATFAVELGAPLALLGVRAARGWTLAAWVFHVGIVALMTVSFLYPLTLLAFVPTLAASEALPLRLPRRRRA
ncbi:MAG: HTTM domain-containing protein [Actinomycetota bacterium]|nr:HTTM domain-containing protein [Actinomycetota bacterium]